MTYWLFLLPFIGAFIGWSINKIAVKMLFYPRSPKKFLWITIQGLFPARRIELAEKIGEYVRSEMASFHLEEKISDPSNLQKAMPVIEGHIDDFLRNKLKEQMPMLTMFIGEKTIQSLKTIFIKELENLFPEVMKQLSSNMKNELDIEKIVKSRLMTIPDTQIERHLAKPIQFATWTGIITGFLIGLVQLVIVLLIM